MQLPRLKLIPAGGHFFAVGRVFVAEVRAKANKTDG
jgi:hypothetical protein